MNLAQQSTSVSPLIESQTTLIIPTLNERNNIEDLVREIRQVCATMPIVVVDDCSSDGTQDVVRSLTQEKETRVSLLERLNVAHRGITASVLHAISQLTTEFFLVMDGDGQHPPSALPALLTGLEKGNLLVSGYRLPYLEKQAWYRVAATQIATHFAKRKLSSHGLPINDPMSGFFGGETDFVRTLVKKSPNAFELEGYKVLFDILKLCDANIDVHEVGYNFRVRRGGASKLAPRHGFLFARSLFR